MVRCTGACLGLARSQRHRLVLALVAPHVLAPADLSQICKYETLAKIQCMGEKSGMLYTYAQLNHINPYNPFTKLPLPFLVFY
jgi:hypothetical protein